MLGKKQFIVDDRLSNSPRRKHNASSTWPEVIVEMSAPISIISLVPYVGSNAPLTVRCLMLVVEARWEVKQAVVPPDDRGCNDLPKGPGV
jgi:hypothetical protein